MKIAFVGKGGSGKTTLSSYFIKYLLEKGKEVITIDGDINVGLADSLGINFDKTKYISQSKIASDIRKDLIGKNDKIKNENYFVKTTPPGIGSNIITFQSNSFFEKYCSYHDNQLKFFHVGTYEQKDIGISCYHSSLSILENILSHTYTRKEDFFIVDMVAGNDSFSNTLHAQFDAVFLILEPTKESIEMGKHFLKLSKEETMSPLYIIANKIEDNDDLKYLHKNFPEIFTTFSYNSCIKKQRREGNLQLDKNIQKEMQNFYEKIEKNISTNPDKLLKNLHILHKKYKELSYIKSPLGDLGNQIDLDFSFKKYAQSKK